MIFGLIPIRDGHTVSAIWARVVVWRTLYIGASMPMNVVILCDGTSNEISQNRTNVLRFYGALEKGSNQVVFYDPGVGTFGAENA